MSDPAIVAESAERPRGSRLLVDMGGIVMFLIPVLMAMGDLAAWVPRLNQIMAILLIGIYLALQRQLRPRPVTEVWLFAAFVLWAGVTGLFVADNQMSFEMIFARIARACGLAIAVAGIGAIRRDATVNLGGILVVALGVAAFSWKTGMIQEGFDTTIQGTTTPCNANTFGVLMLSGIFALAHFWGLKRFRFARPAIPFLALGLAVSLVSSASRKSFSSLVLFLMLWVWFCYVRNRSRNLAGAFVVVAVLLAGGYWFAADMVQNSRLGMRLANTGEDTGDLKRFEMYSALPVLLNVNPWTGVGLGNFGTKTRALVGGEESYSHSDYVEVLATTGVVGALLYLPIYLVWWRRLARIAKTSADPEILYQARHGQAVLLVMLVLGFGVPNFMQTEQWYWIGAMMGAASAWDPGTLAEAPRRTVWMWTTPAQAGGRAANGG